MNKLAGGFTVLMSVYKKNDPTLFKKSISSIYNNTITPDAFILIIDGPVNKKLKKTIYSLKRKFLFKTFFLPVNKGLPRALNFGLSKVKTKWVFRADGDDINYTNRFSEQINFLNLNKNVALLGTAILEVDERGEFISEKHPPLNYAEIIKSIKFRNPFNHMTVAYKLDAVNKVGGYPNIFLKEDYGLWVLLISSGFYCVNIPLVSVMATTGKAFLGRRGGLKYVASEFEIQKLLVKNNLSNKFLSFFVLFFRSLIFLLPSSLKGLVYKFFLRN